MNTNKTLNVTAEELCFIRKGIAFQINRLIKRSYNMISSEDVEQLNTLIALLRRLSEVKESF